MSRHTARPTGSVPGPLADHGAPRRHRRRSQRGHPVGDRPFRPVGKRAPAGRDPSAPPPRSTGHGHRFGDVSVSPPPAAGAAPIQAFSLKRSARAAAGKVGGAIKKKAGSWAPFEAARNFREGFKKDKGKSLRVGMGILGLSGGLKGAEGRELYRDRWESYFQSLPEEEREAARERFPLKPKKEAPASSFADGGGRGGGGGGSDCCDPDPVPGEGAHPPRSSFEERDDSGDPPE